MAKINIDGLLGLNLEEIEIVYRRCKGETVKDVATAMRIGASTIHNTKMKEIFKLLEVENWEEVESELCIPLRRIILSVSALKQGWPDSFREKIEALREPVKSPNELPASEPPQSPQSSPIQPQSEVKQAPHEPAVPSKAEQAPNFPPARTIPGSRPIWIIVAVPLLFLAIFCIVGFGTFSRFIAPLILTPRPTQTLAISGQEHAATVQSTNTVTVTPSQASSPTFTSTSSPTITLEPTSTEILFTPTLDVNATPNLLSLRKVVRANATNDENMGGEVRYITDGDPQNYVCWENVQLDELMTVEVTIDLSGNFQVSMIRYILGKVSRLEWVPDSMETPFGTVAPIASQDRWTESTGNLVTSKITITFTKIHTKYENNWLCIGEIEVYGFPL